MINVLLFVVLFALVVYAGFVFYRALSLWPIGLSYAQAVRLTLLRDFNRITGRG